MDITFHCTNCDDSFDRDYSALVEAAKGIKCDSCGKRLAAGDLEEALTAIDEVLAQVAALRKKFLLSFTVEGDDLPPPYSVKGRGKARADEDEDEDDEDDDDDDLDDGGEEDEREEDY